MSDDKKIIEQIEGTMRGSDRVTLTDDHPRFKEIFEAVVKARVRLELRNINIAVKIPNDGEIIFRKVG
jgi:hypothetical protein